MRDFYLTRMAAESAVATKNTRNDTYAVRPTGKLIRRYEVVRVLPHLYVPEVPEYRPNARH